MHGRGKMTCADGSTYEGDWEHSLRTGRGKITWPSGAVFEGEFEDNNMKAPPGMVRGKKKYANGEYEGDLLGDKRHSLGKNIWNDGIY